MYIVIQTEIMYVYRVCDMSKMLKMPFSFSWNVMLSISKMSKVDSNTPKGCDAMYVEDIKDWKSFSTIPSNTVYIKAC